MSEAAEPSPFTPEQQHALRCVLDQIIPASSDGQMPGAGELGLVDYIEAAASKQDGLAPTIAQGLAEADRIAAGRGAARLSDLVEAERPEVLREVASAQPGFLPSLIFHTYVGYYQHPKIVLALGMETHPPFPKGFPMEQSDLALLDAVRRRPKMYREV